VLPIERTGRSNVPFGKILMKQIYISGLLIAFIGCSPRVQIETPKEPITINLNVKIDHEVRVKIEKDLDQVISKDSGLF
jgi:hypothetical protein